MSRPDYYRIAAALSTCHTIEQAVAWIEEEGRRDLRPPTPSPDAATEPSTEAGRRLLNRRSYWRHNSAIREAILAIEAEARAASVPPATPDVVEALRLLLDEVTDGDQAYHSGAVDNARTALAALPAAPAGLDAAKEAVLAAARAVYESQQVSGSTLPPGHSGVGGQAMTDWVRADRVEDLLDAIDGLLQAERAAAFAEGEQE